MKQINSFIIEPNPLDPRLTREITGIDHQQKTLKTSVTVERPLTLFLNGQEIVTMMTICDYPEYLAIGYLLNQNMLANGEKISSPVCFVDKTDQIQINGKNIEFRKKVNSEIS